MNATHRVTLLPSLPLSFIHNKLHNIKKKNIQYRHKCHHVTCHTIQPEPSLLLPPKHAIKVAPQNYDKTSMCWDAVLPHSPKSLSRRAFDHLQPIGREGLLTCLLHFSLQVKSIMVSVVSQMLTNDLNTLRGLNIFDPHHLTATFHLRGLLNTSISPTHKKYSISGELFNSPPYLETLEDF